MKTNNYIIITLFCLILFLNGCTNKNDIIPEGKKIKIPFTALIESFPDTKTVLEGNTYDALRAIYWLPNDSIAITSGTSSLCKFVNTVGQQSASALFEGEIEESEVYYALYPYNSHSVFDGESMVFDLPTVQPYKAGTFASDYYPMVAKSNVASLSFKNLMGILVLQLQGTEKVQTIQFSGKDASEKAIKLSGSASVLMDYESIPSVVVSDDSYTTVKLDCGEEGVQLNDTQSTPFYIILPPDTYSSFALCITTTSGKVMTKNVTKPLIIKRSERTTTSALKFVENSPTDLSVEGTSNCYVVPSSGRYYFDATVIGNGSEGLLPDIAQSDKQFHTESAVISPLSAQLIWEDTEGLISNITLTDGIISFTASSSKGNALIAVYDNADPTADEAKILWSWHIWCTAIPSTHNYINRENQEFTVLDRNLGATAADYGSGTDAEYLATYGLFYQWGRKDPFPGSASVTSGTEKTLYGNVISVAKEATSSSNGTISNTVSHPTKYYYCTSDPFDWYYGSLRNSYLWGNPYGYNYNSTVPYSSDGTASGTVVLPKKSIYDPCPPGYMVATIDMWTRFTTSGNDTSTSSEFNVDGSFSKGWRFYYAADKSGSTAWYPASGYRRSNDGSLYDVGSGGYYWSSSPYGSSSLYAGYLYFGSGSVSPLNNYGGRAGGFAVRCISESYSPVLPTPTVTTAVVTSINNTSALSGGNVTLSGSADVTARGVCWSTSEYPKIDLETKTTDGVGTGKFTSSITNLSPSTKYYVRAYATNSFGTSYGEQQTFTTSNTSDIEKTTLITFYNATGGDDWKINTNWCSDKDVSEWYGITVNGDGKVVGINLKDNKLSGEISSAISLEYLEELNVASTLYPLDTTNYNNLTKIDASGFPALMYLWSEFNELKSINVNNNEKLFTFSCGGNYLTGVDISKNLQLRYFYCQANKITSLDVSNNTELREFACHLNKLTSLDVSNNTLLYWLTFADNYVSNIDLSNNPLIRNLVLYNNNFTSIDISNLTELTSFACYSNDISALDISNNTKLEYCNCHSNAITTLDVSKNSLLSTLICYSNKISSLDIRPVYNLGTLQCGYQKDGISLALNLSSYQYSLWNSTWSSKDYNTNVVTSVGTADLSSGGTANCYIVPSSGNYSFNATVIGNGASGLLQNIAQSVKKFHTESTVISPLSAQLIWEDTDGLISNITLTDGIISFTASSSKGNAVIAVYDNPNLGSTDAKIIWSWHIWCTDYPSTQNYINRGYKSFKVLDRNLGAIAANPGSDAGVLGTCGLLYEWGRKDPFTGSASISSAVEKTLYGAVTAISRIITSPESGTIANTIANPYVFLYKTGEPYDWNYAERNDYLWGNPYGYNYGATVHYSSNGAADGTVILPEKTIYDPCPQGYMVAPVDTWTRFTTTGKNSNTASEFNVSGSFSIGWNFFYSADNSGATTWYPAYGRRELTYGNLAYMSQYGFYWSSSPLSAASDKAYILDFQSVGVTPLSTPHQRTYGLNIRCVSEAYSSAE